MKTTHDPSEISASKTSATEQSPTSSFGEVLAEAASLLAAADRIGPEIDAAITLLKNNSGRVIFTGLGKTGYVARKSAATFCSTGTPAIFLHPSEALHGDLGVVTAGDILIAISNSGETAEVLELLPHMARLGVPIIALTGNPNSPLALRSQIVLNANVAREADDISVTPTSSTTVAMAMCDALAVTLMRIRGFTKEQFAIFHPGGNLGRKLLTKVCDLMRVGDSVPIISRDENLAAAVAVISAKRLGAVFVVSDQNTVMGILTDGDLRRLFQQIPTAGDMQSNHSSAEKSVAELMTSSPCTISANSLAAEALRTMEEHEITVLPVVDGERQLAGAIHLHDLIRSGLA